MRTHINKNFVTKRALVALGFIFAGCVFVAIGQIERVGAQTSFTRQPFIQNITPTSAVINWKGATGVTVKYGTTATYGEIASGPATVTSLTSSLKITGLSPATKYFYQMMSGATALTPAGDVNYYFKTPPVTGSNAPVTFAVWGDSGDASSAQIAVATQVEAKHPDVVLVAGDVGYPYSGSSADSYYFNIYKNTMRNTPFYPNCGNHDNCAQMSGENSLPCRADGTACGKMGGDDTTFSFEYGNVHFTAINSNNDVTWNASNPASSAAQMAWAYNDIKNSTQPWKVVIWHHNGWSAGSHSTLSEIVDHPVAMAAAAGANLVFWGHSHVYERWGQWPLTTGPAYYTIGNGGKHSSSGCPAISGGPTCKYGSRGEAGFLYVQVSGNTAKVDYITQTGSVPDTATYTISGSGGNPPPASPPPATGDTTPPTISITGPTGGTVTGGQAITVTASDNTAVSRVDFLVDGIVQGSSTVAPFTFTWNSSTVTNGTHTLVAKAYDAANNVGMSASVTITINNTIATPPASGSGDTMSPTASITAPAPGSTIAGTAVITATTADNVGVTQVGFYINNVLKATLSSSPFSFVWDSTTASNGTYNFLVKASDQAGNIGTSATVSYTVANNTANPPPASPPATNPPPTNPPPATPPPAPAADTTLPTVSIVSPASGSTVSGPQTVSASAGDNVGVDRVEFYVDSVLKATDTVMPFSFSWDTTLFTNQVHTVLAKAYDAAGNTSTSLISIITVDNTVPSASVVDVAAPNISITAPQNGAQVSGFQPVNVTASDDVGVIRVEFYVDGLLINSDASVPYTYQWDTLSLANGSHSVRARAYDASGKTKDSTNLTVSVTNISTDQTAPVIITPVLVDTITNTGARVTWGTSELSDSVVHYGMTSSYGDAVNISTLTFNHLVPVVGLSPGVTYHFKVNSKDAAGNLVSSPDATFITTTPDPTTGSIRVRSVGENLVTATSPATKLRIDEAPEVLGTLADLSGLAEGEHSVSFADVPGYKKQFAFCSYDQGGPECTIPNPSSYFPSGFDCFIGYCTTVIYVQAGKVTKIVVRYIVDTAGNVILTVSKSGTGGGTVTGNGIACGSACTSAVPIGSTISLTATPDGSSHFTGWGGACSGSGSCSLVANVSKQVSAIFDSGTSNPPAAPTIGSFTVSPSPLTAGQPATLSWNVTGATSVTIDQGIGAVTGTGTRTVTPTQTTTYTLTANNNGAVTTGTVTLTVTSGAAPAIGSFTASPSPINQGQSSTLSWNVTGATSVTIDQGIGAVTGTGTRTVTPTQTTTYTLTATNGINVTGATTVVVNSSANIPVVNTFTVSPSPLTAGQPATLSWNVTGATSVTIDQGIGAVTGTGTRTVTPTQTTTYTLTANNNGAVTTGTVTLVISGGNNPPTYPTISSFTANPNPVPQGQASILSWSVTGSSTVTINQGIGSVSLTGTRSVNPATTTTYTLSVLTGTTTINRALTVVVSGVVIINENFDAPTPSVSPGESCGGHVIVSWSAVVGATSYKLYRDGGTVSILAAGYAGLSFTDTVSPATSHTYKLVASNASGDSAKSAASVSVTSSVACSSGLAAWWKFDECEPDKNVPSSCPNALASDSSGNGKHLRVNRNGGDPWTNSVGPKKGTGAFRLSDANNTYAVPNTNAGDEFDMRTSDRSVSFWLKIGGSGRDDNDNNDNDSSTNYVIFSKASSAPAAGRWYVASNSGGLFAGFQASAISLTTAPVSGLKDGKWHHILAVWDRDANLTLWVDGVSRASVNISASQETDINTTWPFVVGAYSSLTNAYKDLYVDDMKIFNSVVTPEQADSAGASSGTPPASPPSTSSFSVGSLVHTNSNGSNIHSEAGDGRIVGQHNLNDRGTITRGPTREDGLLWWRVDFYSGVDGWVWENNLSL